VRPGFVAFLVCTAATILVSAWLLTKPPSTAEAPAAAAEASAPPAAVKTPVHARRLPDAPRPAPIVQVASPATPASTLIFPTHMAPVPRRSAASRQEKLLKSIGTTPLLSTGSSLEERWGIQVCGLGLSTGNAMLDMRYKVINSRKALSLVNGNTRAFVFDPATGATLFIPSPPKEGAFPPSGNRLSAGKTYFAAVANQRGVLKSGSKPPHSTGLPTKARLFPTPERPRRSSAQYLTTACAGRGLTCFVRATGSRAFLRTLDYLAKYARRDQRR